MLKAILYDKDGTLMRFDAFWIPVAKAAITSITDKVAPTPDADKIADEIGRKIGIINDTVDSKGILCGGTYSQFAQTVNSVFKKYGVPAEVDRHDIERATADNVKAGVVLPVCDDLRAKLKKAREKAKLFVVTTDDRRITEFCLEKLGVSDLFDGIYCDDGKTPHKPDPFAADDIAKKMNAAKNEIFMIGDTATDKKFADNACVPFVFVGNDTEIGEKSAYSADNAGLATELILNLL